MTRTNCLPLPFPDKPPHFGIALADIRQCAFSAVIWKGEMTTTRISLQGMRGTTQCPSPNSQSLRRTGRSPGDSLNSVRYLTKLPSPSQASAGIARPPAAQPPAGQGQALPKKMLDFKGQPLGGQESPSLTRGLRRPSKEHHLKDPSSNLNSKSSISGRSSSEQDPPPATCPGEASARGSRQSGR